MKFTYNGNNVEIGNDLKAKAEKKFGKLEKYFKKDIDCHVTFSIVKGQRIVEATVYLPGTIIRAEETTREFDDSIDRVTEALERQVRKHKTKLKKRYTNNETIRFDNFEDIPKEEDSQEAVIARTKKFPLKPMKAEEAVLQMELLGHDFFVFLEGDDNEVQVVYKRKDGNYGLLIPELD